MTSFFGGSARASKPTPPATALRIQTSIQGQPIPIGWGTARLAPNLIYTNDFASLQVQQQTGGGGGKGTGGGSSGKQGGGSTQTQYFTTVLFGLCEGPIVGTNRVWNSKNITSAAAMFLTLFNGSYTQTAWSFIVTKHPGDARGYRGIAYLAGAGFSLGTSPDLPAINVEVQFGFFATGAPQDANPRDIVVDVLTNNKYGVQFPASRIGDSNLSTLFNYCQAVGIWMSPVLVQHKSCQAFLTDILYGCVAEAVWSGGAIKIVPYYDASASANGGTYTPNLAPLFDLADDDFIISGNSRSSYSSPVTVKRKAVTDIYNKVSIEYYDRSNNYNPTIIEAKDDASIQAYLLRARDKKQLEHFCLGSAALTCAHLQLGREQVLTTYEFAIGAKYVLLEPMDLVTLTDSFLGLSRKLVRIKEISENEDFTLSIVAEDMLVGAASPPVYGMQVNAGSIVNYNVDPGVTLQPYFFEPTDAFANGLEVLMAVAPVNLTTWGGANVFVSYDGINYAYAGQQLGPTTMGVLTAPLALVAAASTPPTIDAVNTLSVDLSQSGGQVLTATQADLLGFATLCWINSEFLAYRDAVSTGANKYNLTTLNRGGYGTAPISSASGATFVRVNSGVFRIPFTADRIGQTIYVKLVNFNSFGAGPQTLASVSPYTYKILGSALTSALPDVQNFTINFQSNITLFAWDEISDFRNPIDYEIRRGSSWASGQVIGRYLHPNVPAVGSTLSPTQYLIKAHCTPVTGLDVYSVHAAQLTIASGSAVIPLNIVKTFDEFLTGLTGTFAGDLYNNGGIIETSGEADLYTVLDIYALTDWYNNPGPGGKASGTYTIPSGHIINVGRVVGCLIDTAWVSQGVPVPQNIFSWLDIFSMTDIFTSSANVFVTAYPLINLSNDGVTFLGWQRFRAGFYTAMAFNFQMFVQTVDPNTIGAVSAWTYSVHIPSRIDHYIGLSIPNTGLTLTFKPDGSATTAAFNGGPGGTPGTPGLPTWQMAITNQVAGDLISVTSLTLSSCVINITNGGGGVARTVNAEFAGY